MIRKSLILKLTFVVTLFSQFLTFYFNIFYFLNSYFLFITFFFTEKLKININALKSILFLLIFCLFIYYNYSYNYSNPIYISLKSIQFYFGYLILIPCLINLKSSIQINQIIFLIFYVFSLEIIFEFFIIFIFNIYPETIFLHISDAYIYDHWDSLRADLNRVFGLSGNSSVSGVQLLILYLFFLYFKYEKVDIKNLINNIFFSFHFYLFIISFFMVFSGAAFFSLIFALFILFFFRLSNIYKIIFILVSILSIYIIYINSNFDYSSGNKFSINYLLFILFDQDSYTSLIPQVNKFLELYGLKNILFGNYLINWSDEVSNNIFMSVDYSYLNILFEFGIIGLFIYLSIMYYLFSNIHNYMLKSNKNLSFISKVVFLVVFISTFHYPVFSYYFTQTLLSLVFWFSYHQNNYLVIKNYEKVRSR